MSEQLDQAKWPREKGVINSVWTDSGSADSVWTDSVWTNSVWTESVGP